MAKKLAEKLINKTVVKLPDGKEWSIVVNHNVLIECEDLVPGMNLLTGDANLARPSAKLLRALLYCCLVNAGAKYTLKEVGLFITPKNLQALQEGILTSWTNSMPDQEEAKEDPTEAVQE